MEYTHVSSDVSKGKLDCEILGESKRRRTIRKFDNDLAGFQKLEAWALENAEGKTLRFCCESTGCYSLGLASYLTERQYWVSVVNPRRIKHFAIAKNFKQKTDRVDARCIAEFDKAMLPSRWTPPDPDIQELQDLRRRLGQLQKFHLAEGNRLENERLPKLTEDQIHRHREFIEAQIGQVNERIRELMKKNENARRVYRAVTGIKGVGPAVGLLFATMDILSFEKGSEVASFFGLNPVLHQSGKFQGQTRISKGGDSAERALLTSAAACACRFHPDFRAFYETLRGKGLRKTQARTAVARKLLVTAWAIARNALQDKEITYPGGEYRTKAKAFFAPGA